MSEPDLQPPPEPTYTAIEATLAGHERGRRFLAEHARRSRHAETGALLDAIARLDGHAAPPPPAPPAASLEALADDLAALRDLASAVRTALADALRQGGPEPNTGRDPEHDVARMVEGIQETAWRMRESGSEAAFCDLLDGLGARLGRVCKRPQEQEHAIGRAWAATIQLAERVSDIERRLAGTRGTPAASIRDDRSGAGDTASPEDATQPSTGAKRKARSHRSGRNNG